MVNPAHLPAIAAFSGSAAGMLATVVSNWFMQRRKQRLIRRTRAYSHRHKLYKRFIREASRLYADALVTEGSETSNLVNIYSLIAQMRVVSSDAVVVQAEKTGRRILEIYQSPNREFRELPELMEEMDPLRDFSEACRRELQLLGASDSRGKRSTLDLEFAAHRETKQATGACR